MIIRSCCRESQDIEIQVICYTNAEHHLAKENDERYFC